ncbi:MAG: hypothetical protein ACRC33_30290 [Gemmataceae bacterium]
MSENITAHGHGGHGGAADHGHGHAHGGHAPFPFTPEEKKEFQKDDIFAGQAVVVLMAAIFGIGVVLYTVVAWSVGG